MTASSDRALNGAATIFAVQELARSLAYYRDKLGFRVVFSYEGFYAGVERDEVTIHLQSSGPNRRQPGQGALYVFARDVDALHREFVSKGAAIIKPPQDYDYGMRDFDLDDPDGNHLSFGMETRKAAAST